MTFTHYYIIFPCIDIYELIILYEYKVGVALAFPGPWIYRVLRYPTDDGGVKLDCI